VIELTMPTLAVLVTWLATCLLFCAGFLLLNPGWRQNSLFLSFLLLSALEVGGLLFYGSLPFFLFSLRWNVLLSLVYLPAYAIWKLAMVFRDPPTHWIRTPRKHGVADDLCGKAPFLARQQRGGEIRSTGTG
jgi:hypothetical protein